MSLSSVPKEPILIIQPSSRSESDLPIFQASYPPSFPASQLLAYVIQINGYIILTNNP
jgi:hypothetical protein